MKTGTVLEEKADMFDYEPSKTDRSIGHCGDNLY